MIIQETGHWKALYCQPWQCTHYLDKLTLFISKCYAIHVCSTRIYKLICWLYLSLFALKGPHQFVHPQIQTLGRKCLFCGGSVKDLKKKNSKLSELFYFKNTKTDQVEIPSATCCQLRTQGPCSCPLQHCFPIYPLSRISGTLKNVEISQIQDNSNQRYEVPTLPEVPVIQRTVYLVFLISHLVLNIFINSQQPYIRLWQRWYMYLIGFINYSLWNVCRIQCKA